MSKKKYTIFLFSIITLLLFGNSCSSILHNSTYSAAITTNAPNAKIQIYDSIYPLPNNIELTRSKENLDVVLISDESHRYITLVPSLTKTFKFLNLGWFHFASVAYIIDLSNQNRYSYGIFIFLNYYDTINTFPVEKSSRVPIPLKGYFEKKGQFRITNNYNQFNSILYQPNNENIRHSLGFLGFGLGIEYFYQDNKFLAINNGITASTVRTRPSLFSNRDEAQVMHSMYLSLTDNFNLNNFSFGYGINFLNSTWNYYKYGITEQKWTLREIELIERKYNRNYSLGLSAIIYYKYNQHVFIGLKYHNSLYNLKPIKDFNYEHIISLDLNFKFGTKKFVYDNF